MPQDADLQTSCINFLASWPGTCSLNSSCEFNMFLAGRFLKQEKGQRNPSMLKANQKHNLTNMSIGFADSVPPHAKVSVLEWPFDIQQQCLKSKSHTRTCQKVLPPEPNSKSLNMYTSPCYLVILSNLWKGCLEVKL